MNSMYLRVYTLVLFTVGTTESEGQSIAPDLYFYSDESIKGVVNRLLSFQGLISCELLTVSAAGCSTCTQTTAVTKNRLGRHGYYSRLPISFLVRTIISRNDLLTVHGAIFYVLGTVRRHTVKKGNTEGVHKVNNKCSGKHMPSFII